MSKTKRYGSYDRKGGCHFAGVTFTWGVLVIIAVLLLVLCLAAFLCRGIVFPPRPTVTPSPSVQITKQITDVLHTPTATEKPPTATPTRKPEITLTFTPLPPSVTPSPEPTLSPSPTDEPIKDEATCWNAYLQAWLRPPFCSGWSPAPGTNGIPAHKESRDRIVKAVPPKSFGFRR
jgi:hypothetical protein